MQGRIKILGVLALAILTASERAAAIEPVPQLASSYAKLRKIAKGENVRLNVAIVGDSVANNKPRVIMPWFFDAFPKLADSGPTWVTEGDAWIANGTGARPWDNSFSWTGEIFSLGSGGVAWFGTGGIAIVCNRIAIYYATGPTAGHFKLQRSTFWGTPSVWVDEPGYTDIDAYSEQPGWKKIVLTLPVGPSALQIAHVSGGRVVVPLRPIFTDTTRGGVVARSLCRGGLGLPEAVLWNREMALDYLRELDLDLCFFEMKESPVGYAANLDAMQSIFDEARAGTEWIFIGSSPLIPIQDPTDTKQRQENAILEAHASAHGKYYFNGYALVGSYSRMVEMGWQGDGIHESLSCSQYLAGELWKSIGYLIAPRLAITKINGDPVDPVPEKIDFGAVNFRQPEKRTVEVRNVGTIALGDLAVGVTGDGFPLSAPGPTALVPGAATTVDVSLPNPPGRYEGALEFSSVRADGSAVLGLKGRRLSAMQTWRRAYFDSIENSGDAATDADPDRDGQTNAIEFGADTVPTLADSRPSFVLSAGPDGWMHYRFRRNKAALADGWTYDVEWTDSLTEGAWSAAGVREIIVSDDGSHQTVQADIPAPAKPPARFVRLRLSSLGD